MLLTKDFFGYLSLIFVLVSGVPYIWSILKGKTKPHIFTWLLWFLLSAVAAAAQYIGNAGPGAWATSLSALFCLFTLFLAFSHGDKTITRSDWLALVAALCIFPIWYYTESVLLASILATLIDAIGFFPTIRKSYSKPGEEMIFSYVVSIVKHVASIFAIVEYSVTTVFYPALILLMNLILIAVLVLRRHNLAKQSL